MFKGRVFVVGLIVLLLVVLACGPLGTATTAGGEAAPAQESGGGAAPAVPAQEIEQWASGATASSEYGSDSWSAAQATGVPNTAECGDIVTAWASATSDGVDWLKLVYNTPVVPTRIDIYQTYNPGAINRVEVVDTNGQTYEVYQAAPTVLETCPYVLSIFVSGVNARVNTVIIHVDQSATMEWSEIDAVQLVGTP
jgi:hypothetical protein